MDQDLRHSPLHVICCFRKLPGSLSLSGSACPSDDVEPWSGGAGWGVAGLQGGGSNLAGHSAWGLWGHPASPGKPVFQDSMDVKKGIGCKGAGGAGVRRRLKADSSCCSLGRARGSCSFSQLWDGKMPTQLYLLEMMQVFSNYGIQFTRKEWLSRNH